MWYNQHALYSPCVLLTCCIVGFAGMGFLSQYLAGKLQLFDGRGVVFKTLLVFLPLYCGMLIAVSRITDNRHHPGDVITSSILGIIYSWYGYRQFFPPLGHVESQGRPYIPREYGKHSSDGYESTDIPLDQANMGLYRHSENGSVQV